MFPFGIACYATREQESANENVADFYGASKFRQKDIKTSNGGN